MGRISIRNYHPDDLAALIDLFRRSVRMLACRDYSARQILAWAPDDIDPEAFAMRRASKSTWVAKIDGQIAGFSDLDQDGHIDMLFVEPQDQRKGVAHALLAHIETIAIRLQLDRIYAEASITARRTFERRGFEIVATQSVIVRGEAFINHRMEKQLPVHFLKG
jgi:putative acetyltransferase